MPRIYGISLREFFQITKIVMQRYFELPVNKNPERTGAYLAVFDKAVPKMISIVQIEEINPKMADGSLHYVQEKIERLWHNRSRGHFSCWQSRQKDLRKFGGGITAPDDSMANDDGKKVICAMSGLREESEEAILLVDYLYFGWIDMEDAKRFIEISDNQAFLPLLAECYDMFVK